MEKPGVARRLQLGSTTVFICVGDVFLCHLLWLFVLTYECLGLGKVSMVKGKSIFAPKCSFLIFAVKWCCRIKRLVRTLRNIWCIQSVQCAGVCGEMGKDIKQSLIFWHKVPAWTLSVPWNEAATADPWSKGPPGQWTGIRRLSFSTAEALGSASEGVSLVRSTASCSGIVARLPQGSPAALQPPEGPQHPAHEQHGITSAKGEPSVPPAETRLSWMLSLKATQAWNLSACPSVFCCGLNLYLLNELCLRNRDEMALTAQHFLALSAAFHYKNLGQDYFKSSFPSEKYQSDIEHLPENS